MDPTGKGAAGAGRMARAGPPAGGKAQGRGRGAQPGGGRVSPEQAGAGRGQAQGGGEPMEAMNAANRAGRSTRARAKPGEQGPGARQQSTRMVGEGSRGRRTGGVGKARGWNPPGIAQCPAAGEAGQGTNGKGSSRNGWAAWSGATQEDSDPEGERQWKAGGGRKLMRRAAARAGGKSGAEPASRKRPRGRETRGKARKQRGPRGGQGEAPGPA